MKTLFFFSLLLSTHVLATSPFHLMVRSGQIALNNNNELVFTVVLESKNGEQRMGSAIYKVKISEELF